jgi:hypothetical protein
MKKTILPNWERIIDSGFGNKHNICLWSMKEYKGYLYAGTLNFKDGCEIYRSRTGDKNTWEKVNENGFGIKNRCDGARTMLVYEDILWVVTHSTRHGSQIWVTNGEYDDNRRLLKWRKANINGFGEGEMIPASRAMAIYKKKLYVGTECKGRLPRIYRYDGTADFDDIKPDRWIWINNNWENDFFNISKIFLIGDILIFRASDNNEYMYMSIYSDDIAYIIGEFRRHPNLKNILEFFKFFYKMRCNIIRYNGKKWEKVSKPGFGKKNIMTMASLLFKDTIYFGTTNILGGEIWKSDDGLNWIRIMKRGFCFPFNISVWRMHSFENKLIVGMQNQWLGSQVWASKNEKPVSNKDFIQIAKTGMEDKIYYNPLKLKQDGIRTFETFKNQLYVGTASDMNIFFSNKIGPGCQIWRIKSIKN